MTKNKDVADLLRNFAKYYSIAGDNFRQMAYRNAAMTIDNLDKDISLYQDVQQLKNLPRIGEGIAEKIKEYLTTGKSESLEELKHSVVRNSFEAELYEIEGFGKSTIDELFRHFTIHNLEDLENVLKTKAVRNIPGFGMKKAHKLLEALEEHKSGGIRRNIPFLEAWESANSLLDYLKDDRIEKISVAGSLRRMKPTVNDIDIIASVKDSKVLLKENKSQNSKMGVGDSPQSTKLGMERLTATSSSLLLKFTKSEQVKRVVQLGETKATVMLKNGIQADLRVVKQEEYYTALQYFTGSKEHNVQIRAIAKDKGYLLSEYGLFDRETEDRIPIQSEEEIYEKLGLPFPEPINR